MQDTRRLHHHHHAFNGPIACKSHHQETLSHPTTTRTNTIEQVSRQLNLGALWLGRLLAQYYHAIHQPPQSSNRSK